MSDFFIKERSDFISSDILITLQKITIEDLIPIIQEYAELTKDNIHQLVKYVISDIFSSNSVGIKRYLSDKSIANLEYILGMVPWSILFEIKHWDSKTYLLLNLLIDGIDVNVPDDKGYTLLYRIINRTKETSVKERLVNLLIQNKANVNQCNIDGSTPLKMAIRKVEPSIVKILLDNGANIFSEYGISPYDLLHSMIGERHSVVTSEQLQIINEYFDKCFEEQFFRMEEIKRQKLTEIKEKKLKEKEMKEKEIEQKKEILKLYEQKKKQIELEKQLQEIEHQKAEELREQVIKEALNNVDDETRDDSGTWD